MIHRVQSCRDIVIEPSDTKQSLLVKFANIDNKCPYCGETVYRGTAAISCFKCIWSICYKIYNANDSNVGMVKYKHHYAKLPGIKPTKLASILNEINLNKLITISKQKIRNKPKPTNI